MSFLKEFKQFAMRGNMIDLAVGFVVGGAFSTMVNSLVNDIIMPPIGVLLQGIDFSEMGIVLVAGEDPVLFGYGAFLNTMINFTIIAFAIFLVVKGINRLKKEEAPSVKDCSECKMEIPVDAKRCGHCTSVV